MTLITIPAKQLRKGDPITWSLKLIASMRTILEAGEAGYQFYADAGTTDPDGENLYFDGVDETGTTIAVDTFSTDLLRANPVFYSNATYLLTAADGIDTVTDMLSDMEGIGNALGTWTYSNFHGSVSNYVGFPQFGLNVDDVQELLFGSNRVIIITYDNLSNTEITAAVRADVASDAIMTRMAGLRGLPGYPSGGGADANGDNGVLINASFAFAGSANPNPSSPIFLGTNFYYWIYLLKDDLYTPP